ncbi:DUF4032 domain-containing protein [Auritidibacter ignavus]|uniref:DUF4032 domain-containing protein n=1 Tax=Auritidibacter ignavus TaxID=678932 RepID=UPI0024B9686E|nr:DUF4032 domain-containing protein [Auritidibacter ignavus]WHS34233.1 DUF4032 domain-containing protein [Auritidibacter ignavus]
MNSAPHPINDQVRISSTHSSPTLSAELLDLPLHQNLEDWPEQVITALPRGISRHVVRFVRLPSAVVALKETTPAQAQAEYGLLRQLGRRDIPCVVPLAVITGRRDPADEPLPAMLVTQHLPFSLPYRAVLSQQLSRDTLTRVIDALAVLIVQLHLEGLYWGDISLSNVLFRRDAGGFAAYLVDAETGELRTNVSAGQRAHDMEIARTNIAGELMDLIAGGLLAETVDPVATAEQVSASYRNLWHELTTDFAVPTDQRMHLQDRIRRLNELGFDVEEYDVTPARGGRELVLNPKVVDPGHHRRRLLQLTGLSVEENQARRLLQAIDDYRREQHWQTDEHLSAQLWLQQVFDPIIQHLPAELAGKMEPAEIMHEILEHRWYLSERAGQQVSLEETVTSYLQEILTPRAPDDPLTADTVSRSQASRPNTEYHHRPGTYQGPSGND